MSLAIVPLLLLAFRAAAGNNRIESVQVFVPDCDSCGMSFLGDAGLTVCGPDEKCCETGKLENYLSDDWDEGEISSFSDEKLGPCNKFNLPESEQIRMKLQHYGSDGGMFDYVNVFTNRGFYNCKFAKFLDDDDFEWGHNCRFQPTGK